MEVKEPKYRKIIYKDAFICRLPNRKIIGFKEDGGWDIDFYFFQKGKFKKNQTKRFNKVIWRCGGVYTILSIRLSNESFEAICEAGLLFNQIHQTPFNT